MAEVDIRRLLGQVIAKAWRDDGFKQALIADPVAVLGREGVAVPAGVAVRVVEDSHDLVHLVLPPKLGDGVSGPILAAIAGGWSEEEGSAERSKG